MASKKARVIIDLRRAKMLLRGESITVRLPEGVRTLEIFMSTPKEPTWSNPIAEILDVFFNGRPAR